MIKINNQIFNIKNLERFALKFCKEINKGDIILLKGELGAGKTTFARYLINNFYKLQNIKKPNTIKSPSFPILLTYDLKEFEIYHYDLYRINSPAQLNELVIEENLDQSITLIEWPELILDNEFNKTYYLVEFKINTNSTRFLNVRLFK